jgi:hypothetical protein
MMIPVNIEENCGENIEANSRYISESGAGFALLFARVEE